MDPEPGCSSSSNSRIRVDFPAPFAPFTATRDLRQRLSDTSFTTMRRFTCPPAPPPPAPPYAKTTFFILSTSLVLDCTPYRGPGCGNDIIPFSFALVSEKAAVESDSSFHFFGKRVANSSSGSPVPVLPFVALPPPPDTCRMVCCFASKKITSVAISFTHGKLWLHTMIDLPGFFKKVWSQFFSHFSLSASRCEVGSSSSSSSASAIAAADSCIFSFQPPEYVVQFLPSISSVKPISAFRIFAICSSENCSDSNPPLCVSVTV
mmetsp:Transcript_25578/g.64459  ORF Transcript_25578/g.64459 Transcript_25578/m.64459 type:complete len:263 (+) Transcript_25578:1416-2204(+)